MGRRKSLTTRFTAEMSLFGLKTELDLEYLHARLPLSTDFSARGGQLLGIYVNRQWVTVFAVGKLILLNATSIDKARRVLRRAARAVQKCCNESEPSVQLIRPGRVVVRKVTSRLHLGYTVSLKQLADNVEDAFYEPEIDFPCARFSIPMAGGGQNAPRDKCECAVFANGKVIFHSNTAEMAACGARLIATMLSNFRSH